MKTQKYFKACVLWHHVNPVKHSFISLPGRRLSQYDKQIQVEEFNVLCRRFRAVESLTALLLFNRNFPPTSSNGDLIRVLKPGHSNSRQNRVIKTMFPLFLCVYLLCLSTGRICVPPTQAGQSPVTHRACVTCVYVNGRDKVDEWHVFAVLVFFFFSQLWDQEDTPHWLFSFSFLKILWLICVNVRLSSLSNKVFFLTMSCEKLHDLFSNQNPPFGLNPSFFLFSFLFWLFTATARHCWINPDPQSAVACYSH